MFVERLKLIGDNSPGSDGDFSSVVNVDASRCFLPFLRGHFEDEGTTCCHLPTLD